MAMYLGIYRFEGDPDALVEAYDRFIDQVPPGDLLWHACTRDATGITIVDACPSREVFRSFSSSPDVLAAFAAAGLPAPTVSELGDVHRTAGAGR